VNIIQITENEVCYQLEKCRKEIENLEQCIAKFRDLMKRREEDEERLNCTLSQLQKQAKRFSIPTWTDLSSLALFEYDQYDD
jgi:chromosome segregation ATPase